MDYPKELLRIMGAVFTSEEFENFLHGNGIVHTRTAPYHPASNGLAERAVQTFKQGIKRLREGTVETKLSRFLMKYRLTPHATTGRSPAELLLGRQPRSRLDLLHPDVSGRVQESQARQQRAHDSHSRARAFQVGDRVDVCSKFFRIASMDGRNYFGQDWSSFISNSFVRWTYLEVPH